MSVLEGIQVLTKSGSMQISSLEIQKEKWDSKHGWMLKKMQDERAKQYNDIQSIICQPIPLAFPALPPHCPLAPSNNPSLPLCFQI